MTTRSAPAGLVAMILIGVGLCEIVSLAVAVALMGARGGFDPVASFIIPNAPAGIAFLTCGVVIVRHRPGHPVGWLFVVGGLGNLTAAAAAGWVYYSVVAGWPVPLTQTLVTIFSASWPAGSFLAYPLALLLFPDGRLPSPRWRAAIGLQILAWTGIVLDQALHPIVEGMPAGAHSLTAVGWADALGPLWALTGFAQLASMVVVVAGVVVRYRRGDEIVRRQLLWLMLAGGAAMLSLAVYFLGHVSPLILLTFVLIPVSVGIAIARYDLLDVRLVVSRAVAYALLTATLLVGYAALVWLADLVLGSQSLGGPVVAAILIALVLNPARLWLQARVERLLYGNRRDPIRTVAAVGESLSDGNAEQTVLDTLRDALRVPYAAIRSPYAVVQSGTEVPGTEVTMLTYADRRLGELVIGLRPGQQRLGRTDRTAVAVVAAPLALALHATELARDLRASQSRLVTTREEERRRIRNDLHDGLGPALTGMAFTIDGVINVLDSDPALARAALLQLRSGVGSEIDEVRRLIERLRPPALDQLGLVGALRVQAERLQHRSTGEHLTVDVSSAAELPTLPAAAEIAAFRIATEALLNVSRHSDATRATVRIDVGDDLEIAVTDNGTGSSPWQPGLGLTSMSERARELAGVCTAGPTPHGGQVRARLPLPAGGSELVA